MAKNERFEKVYSQGTLTVTQIWVDRETGVNYLYHMDGYSGGLTPLLDRDGKPVISPVINGSAETDRCPRSDNTRNFYRRKKRKALILL